MFTMMGERGRMELHRSTKHCEFLNEVSTFKRYLKHFLKGTHEEFSMSVSAPGACTVLVCVVVCWFE